MEFLLLYLPYQNDLDIFLVVNFKLYGYEKVIGFIHYINCNNYGNNYSEQ
jgi:hypothetical protein